jgi:hypothetical protein
MGLRSFGYNGSAFSSLSASVNMVAAETFSASAQGSYIYFGTTASGTTTHSEKMRILGNGSVGIGTSVTQYSTYTAAKLVAAADVTLTSGNYAGDVGCQIQCTGATSVQKRLALMYDTTNNIGLIQAMVAGTGTSPLCLNAAGGYVGVGTTISPGYALDVSGDINCSGSHRVGGVLQPRLTPAASGSGASSYTIGTWDITNYNSVEIRINWTRNGTSGGTMTFSFKDSANNSRSVQEAYTNCVTPTGATTGSGAGAILASNSEAAANSYGALIRIWSVNTGGTGGRYHYEFTAVGCYASVGATRNYGGGYVTVSSGTINQLVLATSAGTFEYKSSVTCYV